MTLGSTLDLLYLVLAVMVGWVTLFLCWALFELARLLRQANEVVTDARTKASRLENAIRHSASYLGILAAGGKAFLSMFNLRQATKKRRKKTDDEEE
ncbi:hypothetical protein HY479_01125 [Candidatus Uhrbacteria bacterium]|nr:hypothetical protein [Candidatus Uhrbacteria bacterium]